MLVTAPIRHCGRTTWAPVHFAPGQQEGGEKVSIKPGDVIWTPPGVKHWHGGGVSSSLSHIAVAPMVEAKNVDWLEPVSDAQYR